MRKIVMNSRKIGFTLVELSLSIAFISILSIIIVVIINNTLSSYRRGLTLNKINSTGMDLVDDIRSAIQNSSNKSLTELCERRYKQETNNTTNYNNCINDGARNFVVVTRSATVNTGRGTIYNVPVYGAFCTGTYSYIWNSGYFSKENGYTISGGVSSPAELKYMDINGDVKTKSGFKLLKLEDDDRAVCTSAVFGTDPQSTTHYYKINSQSPINKSSVFDITKYQVIQDEPIDILASDSENNLAIYDFWSAKPAESKSKYGLFYVASFVLGTLQGGINVKAAGDFCATPANLSLENMDYCAINKFNIASQAMGA